MIFTVALLLPTNEITGFLNQLKIQVQLINHFVLGKKLSSKYLEILFIHDMQSVRILQK